MPYIVGIAKWPKVSDQEFDDESAAIERAVCLAREQGFYEAVAVWDEQRDPVWLFMLGEQFRKV